MGGPTYNAMQITKNLNSKLSNIQHYMCCMPSRRLWQLNAPLVLYNMSIVINHLLCFSSPPLWSPSFSYQLAARMIPAGTNNGSNEGTFYVW